MPQQTFTVSDNARVEIRNCHNRVTVVGWDDAHTVAVDYAGRQQGDTIVVENTNKVTLRVPRAATLSISRCEADVRIDDLSGHVELEHIDGDVTLRNLRGETIVRDLDGSLAAKDVTSLKSDGSLDGDVALRDVANVHIESVEGDISLTEVSAALVNQVAGDFVARGVKALKGDGVWEGDAVLHSVQASEINEVEGDVSLSDIGAFKSRSVGGDLSAQNIRSAFAIEQVEGDISIRESSGQIMIERGGGDLIASDLRGGLTAQDIDGDAVISFSEAAPLDLRADGDVVVNLPPNTNAEIELDAPRGDLIVRANMQIHSQDESRIRATMGSGGVKIKAESTKSDLIMRGSGGDMHHREKSKDYANFSAEFDFSSFADMGQRIAAEVRKSVNESLADLRVPEVRARRHHFEVRMHRPGRHHEHRHDRDDKDESRNEPVEEETSGPVAGSPERKAILDAIARGEMSVDDAIRKLTGEE
ncbi:MAG: DUF4097 family beta strand repeat protein [Chloroflexi bacterium]|nr:DUF4097 family beta strand repeat protein [Chloroflexota bacterium]